MQSNPCHPHSSVRPTDPMESKEGNLELKGLSLPNSCNPVNGDAEVRSTPPIRPDVSREADLSYSQLEEMSNQVYFILGTLTDSSTFKTTNQDFQATIIDALIFVRWGISESCMSSRKRSNSFLNSGHSTTLIDYAIRVSKKDVRRL